MEGWPWSKARGWSAPAAGWAGRAGAPISRAGLLPVWQLLEVEPRRRIDPRPDERASTGLDHDLGRDGIENGLGEWLADRIVENGEYVKDDLKLGINVTSDPFLDERLRVANLPGDTQTIKVKNPTSGVEKEIKIALFKKAAASSP